MKTHFITLLACCLLISNLSLAQDVDDEVALPTTIMEFENPEFDFGKIRSGEKVSHVFKFTNTGAYPLIISNAKASCGCTVPFYPKVPVMPGESSELEVAFDARGKQGLQRKSVTITANTEPGITVLMVSGEILPPEEEAGSEENEAAEMQRSKDEEAIKAISPNCFAIYPNPTNHTLQLELKEHIGRSARVDIHNEMGQKILSKEIERVSRDATRFDVSTFLPGIYMITIRVHDHQPMTQCFVVTGK